MRRFFRFLKRLFSKPVSNDYGSGPVEKLTWGYVVCHTRKDKGATNGQAVNRLTEYDYSLSVARLLRGVIPYATRDDGGVYQACRKLKKVGCNASIEFHLNAFDSSVNGAEILVIADDEASIEVAQNILDAFKMRFPDRKIRGVKEKRSGKRGRRNLDDAKDAGMRVRILTELFFIDSEFIDEKIMADFLKKTLAQL